MQGRLRGGGPPPPDLLEDSALTGASLRPRYPRCPRILESAWALGTQSPAGTPSVAFASSLSAYPGAEETSTSFRRLVKGTQLRGSPHPPPGQAWVPHRRRSSRELGSAGCLGRALRSVSPVSLSSSMLAAHHFWRGRVAAVLCPHPSVRTAQFLSPPGRSAPGREALKLPSSGCACPGPLSIHPGPLLTRQQALSSPLPLSTHCLSLHARGQCGCCLVPLASLPSRCLVGPAGPGAVTCPHGPSPQALVPGSEYPGHPLGVPAPPSPPDSSHSPTLPPCALEAAEGHFTVKNSPGLSPSDLSWALSVLGALGRGQ